MLIGCHLSIAGGLHKAITRAEDLETNALQIFSHNARSWTMKPLDEDEPQKFQATQQNGPVDYVVIHTSYLINLASPKDDVYEKSVDALKKEIERAGLLGIPHVNTHVGKHLDAGVDAGIANIIRAINEVLASDVAQAYPDVQIVLENDAGQGTALGSTFEELGRIVDGVDQPERLAVCFDTCHGLAAGYDFRSEDDLEQMLAEVEETVGLDRLVLLHVNDSKHPLGAFKDRHEHIGRGHIGLDGFRPIVNHPRTRDLPLLLETPKDDSESDKLDSTMDPINLQAIRDLREA